MNKRGGGFHSVQPQLDKKYKLLALRETKSGSMVTVEPFEDGVGGKLDSSIYEVMRAGEDEDYKPELVCLLKDSPYRIHKVIYVNLFSFIKH